MSPLRKGCRASLHRRHRPDLPFTARASPAERPDDPFLFRVSATGASPRQFSASNFGLSAQDRAGKPLLAAALEEKALLENTLFVFMSDNGAFFGEHGLSVERRLPYEESIKSPLIITHPAAIEPRRVDEFALSIDIAPTLLEAAQTQIPRSVQGRSLLPFALGRRTRGREAFLVEYYGHENPFPWLANIDYRAVRFGRYKYIRWIREDEAHELYDLETDPFELRNLAADKAHVATVARAREHLAARGGGSLGLPATQPL